MSYLKFDKTLMINLEESLSREVLRTNRKGAYSCTTIVDCNTRKYHGLLVMPVPALDEENHVLLSSLDETVIQHGAAFNLGLHKYEGGAFSPNGHKYIREYTMETVPRSVYRVGGVVLSKEKTFSTTDNQILIKYTLLDAHSRTTLQFRPFLAFRSVKELTHVNGNANQSYETVTNGIKVCMYPGYPELYMQFNKKPVFVYEPYWYHGIEYPKEQERGYPYKEDLFVPGYFELSIKKGETIVFCGGDMPRKDLSQLPDFFDEEIKMRTPRSDFYNCLKNSAHQLLYKPNGKDTYLLAGYPWFKVRARDMFVAMPGATLCINEKNRFEQLIESAMPALRRFMEDGKEDAVIHEISDPDVLLWAIWCIQQYSIKAGTAEAKERYGALVGEIIRYIIAQKHPNLVLTDNGLLYSEGRNKPVTWMNSMINGKPVVPRTGYIVEFNALWYNALCFYKEQNEGQHSEKIDQLIEKLANSFPATFVNKYGYLFDYVGGANQDWSVRPNMVIALACPYSPLSRIQKRAALDVITKELLTPKGLRSLSPKSEGYHPICTGPQYERDLAYHQGAVWPWLIGMYLTAYLNLFGRSGVSFAERMLISLEEEISNHCIGTISEVFDGNPPFTGRGAISFLMNIASILDVIDKLRRYERSE
ncbi:MAG: amylo-alpha-1,6-glucosidase [Tannerella sp.]|jgi:predicted glycogen debranching enzyme|nr:amylo-alpha-1,6-glucosidase [Tannerella sp.]